MIGPIWFESSFLWQQFWQSAVILLEIYTPSTWKQARENLSIRLFKHSASDDILLLRHLIGLLKLLKKKYEKN